jgi:biopolymer transport protein ExbD
MKFRHRRHEEVEINIINLIDVLLVLLIFFVMTTTFAKKAELNITLPEASKDISEPKLEIINIAIDAQSRIYVNNKELINTQINTIKQAMHDLQRDMTENATVVINADEETPHKTVIKVMDAARQIGLVRITFAVRNTSEEE